MASTQRNEERLTATASVALDAIVHTDEATRLAVRLGSAAPVSARVPEALLPLVVAAAHALRAETDRPALALVVEDDDAARELAERVRAFRPDAPVAYLPHRGAVHGSGLEPPPHLVGERARALEALAEGGICIVSADAIVERLPPRERRPVQVRIERGALVDRDELLAELVAAGYERVAGTVEDRGQVSARGDVVDIFPTTGREPIRVELFGDEIERVSVFSNLTQRSLRDLDAAVVQPAGEERPGATDGSAYGTDEDEHAVPAGLVPVLPELVAHGPLVVWDRPRIRRSVAERLAELAGAHRESIRRGYLREEVVGEALDGAHGFDSLPAGQSIAFDGHPPALAARGIAEAETELRSFVRAGLRVVLTFPTRGDAERAQLMLKRAATTILEPGEPLPAQAGVLLVESRLRTGLVSAALRLAVLPAGLLLRRSGSPATDPRVGRAIRSFTDLKPGDYVVHEDHGVAQFLGFDTKTVAGITRDYLHLQYRGEDRVFVPHEQIGKVSRYIGADSRPPSLSKLGARSWLTLKARVRVAVHEMAGELLALYAQRQSVAGHSYPSDGDYLLALERDFPYEETDDQARAIEAVRADLGDERPMDRLVCGDVGFGKTEVALRAALAVIEGGRQVLMLVPTTILAQQHYQTFRDRFRDFPVELELASRFRRPAEMRAAIAAFNAGSVDMLIGTHRVLSRDVIPPNLGLVIVDEEQRFGVGQKELLRQLRTEVDVLALSATPIPRTLHMSLAGLRDISVIATPPRGRRPVKTHVGEFDDELVRLAITREIARGGQAFYLHNRVESIDEAATRLRRLLPEARIGVGHGKMTERQLEGVMQAFLRGDYDVLVATTIIESGLDIPQANTIVIERADTLGLSQLYQIRGRVGRSDVAAQAYLFYPDAGDLSDEARQRLSALADYTELGSGFRVAMRDLELRGAGNLLGDEQSGHVAAIGFELYCEMLAEAVAELQGMPPESSAVQPRIDGHVSAYVPADWVGLEAAKMDVHRRIALARAVDELRELEVELADRFGPLPEPVANLIGLQELRLIAQPLGAVAISVRRDRVVVTNVLLGAEDLRTVRTRLPKTIHLTARREVAHRVEEGERPVEVARELLEGVLDTRRVGVR